MITASEAPTWDLTPFFPSLESSEFSSAFQNVIGRIEAFASLLESQSISKSSPVQASDAEQFDRLVQEWNSLSAEVQLVEAFIAGYTTVDTTNELAEEFDGRLSPHMATLSRLGRTVEAWVGTRDFDSLKAAKEFDGHAYWAEKCKTTAIHTMSDAEEDLASALKPSASSAWVKLHSDVTSQLSVPFRGENLPMTVVRNLAYDPDAATRKEAYEAELKTWKTVEIPCAAAMNGVKGEVVTLCRRRGWSDPLDPAVFDSNIDQATLEAMLDAARASFPVLRRAMRAKARLLGSGDRLPWYDLFAPVGSDTANLDYAEGAALVIDQFRTFSDRLADFAQHAVDHRWIDAKPGPAKVGGAFCMTVRGGESRLLQTWKPSFGACATLAHELGHGYHAHCLANRTMIQGMTPMPLAETASIFCETIALNAAKQSADREGKLNILENDLQRSIQVVVDITSRFEFERAVFAKRKERPLTVSELNEAMLASQEATYGDGLSEERHAYMWAVKPHYYSTFSFYNYPYMFGQLFALGLYAQYQSDPEKFKAMYDDLLSSTGMAPAAELAARFGIDIRSSKFWEGSLQTIESTVVEFEALCE